MQAQPSVFSRLTLSLAQTSKWRQCNEKQEFSKLEYTSIIQYDNLGKEEKENEEGL